MLKRRTVTFWILEILTSSYGPLVMAALTIALAIAIGIWA